MERDLYNAHIKASEMADSQQSASTYLHLSGVLYDLYCYFSEEGINDDQHERLRKMGFPDLQNRLAPPSAYPQQTAEVD